MTRCAVLLVLVSAGLASCSGLGRFYDKEFVVYDGKSGEAVERGPRRTAEASAGADSAAVSPAADGAAHAAEAAAADPRTAAVLERIFVLRMMSREFAQAIRDGLDPDGRMADRKAAVERELGVRIRQVGAEVWREAREQRLRKLLELEVEDPAAGGS